MTGNSPENNMIKWIEESEKYLSQSDAEAEERYKQYKTKDPFPNILPSLLNSADIYKYVKETGMIFPFSYKDDGKKDDNNEVKIVGAKGATFPIKIGDQCIYWDNQNIRRVVDLREGSFMLQKNSIVFVELEPMFRVPDYIVLRFNLKIKHVYKGLLLGTGPVVDPGFCGKLYIPLHNLTNNDYEFHKGDELIEMEFTKLSHNTLWENSHKNSCKKNQTSKDIKEGYYFSFPHKEPRKFNEYLTNALKDSLQKSQKTRSNEHVEIINNSIPVEIQEQTKTLKDYDDRLKTSEKKIEKELRESSKFRKIGYFAGSVAALSMILSVSSIHISETNRHDGLIKDIVRLESEYNDLSKKIEIAEKEKIDLKKKLNLMEKESKKLKEEVKSMKKRRN